VTFEETFRCSLGSNYQLEVQRYGAGDGIGAHTDLGTPEIRMVLNLNRGWTPNDGGIWVLASDSALKKQTYYLPSLSNTGFAFATHDSSFHSLSVYRGSEAFVLVLRIPRR
jgi:Rps23 Pro-64 3,4-dihydroxylase Tpa1-like proline 4-hydroxylase